jgi:CRP-like cAMP-binding protein
MVKTITMPHRKVGELPTPGKLGEQIMRNAILLGLPRREYKTVLAKLEFVELPTGTILDEMAGPIKFGYFINAGLASILNIMLDGKSVEVGLSGKEGFVGLPLIVGFDRSPIHAVMQIGGSAYRLKAQDMERVLRQCPTLEKHLHRYAQEFALQITQVAACNRLHEVRQRLARWLLMSEDRMGASTFPLTQQFIAHMLGSRRASVTVAAGALQKARLIAYKRGTVNIMDRAGLEKAACDCYRQLSRQMELWSR